MVFVRDFAFKKAAAQAMAISASRLELAEPAAAGRAASGAIFRAKAEMTLITRTRKPRNINTTDIPRIVIITPSPIN